MTLLTIIQNKVEEGKFDEVKEKMLHLTAEGFFKNLAVKRLIMEILSLLTTRVVFRNPT